jgi:DNA-directed RNA polymerase subunit RPC12/RpoP
MMENDYVMTGTLCESEIVDKVGLVFNDGRIYSVERHKGSRGSYTKSVDITRQVALALKGELDKIESEHTQHGKKCSKCGTTMEADTSAVYTSDPPMFLYKCPNCGNQEYGLCSEL